MRIEWVPIETVTRYARNPRRTEAAVAKVAASIREYGFRQPIVTDADRVIVVGHTRLEAAKRLGLGHVPIHVADDLTPQQLKAYRLADNRTGEEAEWDEELLALELGELADLGAELELTGFDEAEIRWHLQPPDFAPAGEDEQGKLDERKKVTCPECGHEFEPKG